MDVSKVNQGVNNFTVSMDISAPGYVTEKELGRAIIKALAVVSVVKKKKNGELVDISNQISLENFEVEEDHYDCGYDEEDEGPHEYEWVDD